MSAAREKENRVMKRTTLPTLLTGLAILCTSLVVVGAALSWTTSTIAMAQTSLPTWITTIAWSPDVTKFATGDDAGVVKIWTARTKQLLFTLTGHTGRVNDVRWSPDGTRLASAGDDKSVRIWNTTNGQSVYVLQDHITEAVSVAWSPDGSKLASSSVADEVNALHIWNPATGQLVSSHVVSGSVDLAWSPDGSKLAGAIPFGRVLVLNTATFESANGFELILLPEDQRGIFSVAWSPNNLKMASGSNEGSVVIWDVVSKQPLFDLRANDVPPTNIATSLVLSLAFSSDGSKLASVAGDGTIRTWNATSGQVLSTTQVTGPLKAAALSRDGTKLVYSGSSGSPQTTDVPTLSSTLKLQYYPQPDEAGTIGDAIGPDFNIVNMGSTSVPLSELKIRYYFTREGTSPLQFHCWYTDLPAGQLCIAIVVKVWC